MKYKNCQSCGMPFKRDEKGGGTEKDGTKSTKFCSHCYKNGEFTRPNITVKEMQKIVEEKIREFGMPKFLTKLFTRNIPKLERWREQA
jgi:Putative zinc ribbon domain